MSSSSSRPQLTVPSPTPFWPSSSSSNSRKLRGTFTPEPVVAAILRRCRSKAGPFFPRALSYQYLHHARSPYLINLPSFRGNYVVFNFLFYLNFSLRFLSISLKWSPRRGITGSKNRNKQGPTIGHPIIIIQKGLMCPPSPRCVFVCICVYTHVQICTCATFSIWDSNTELKEQSPRTPGTWPHEDQGFKLLASGPTAATEKGPGLNDQKNAPLRAHHWEHTQQSSRIHIDGHFSKGLGGGRVFLDMQVKIGATQ